MLSYLYQQLPTRPVRQPQPSIYPASAAVSFQQVIRTQAYYTSGQPLPPADPAPTYLDYCSGARSNEHGAKPLSDDAHD